MVAAGRQSSVPTWIAELPNPSRSALVMSQGIVDCCCKTAAGMCQGARTSSRSMSTCVDCGETGAEVRHRDNRLERDRRGPWRQLRNDRLVRAERAVGVPLRYSPVSRPDSRNAERSAIAPTSGRFSQRGSS
jgi:hypothetical protein